MADAGDLKSPEACNLVWVRLPLGPSTTRNKERFSPFLGLKPGNLSPCYFKALNELINKRLFCWGTPIDRYNKICTEVVGKPRLDIKCNNLSAFTRATGLPLILTNHSMIYGKPE